MTVTEETGRVHNILYLPLWGKMSLFVSFI